MKMGTANYQTNQLHNYSQRFYSNTQMYYIVNKIISLEPNTRLLYLPEQVAEKLDIAGLLIIMFY